MQYSHESAFRVVHDCPTCWEVDVGRLKALQSGTVSTNSSATRAALTLAYRMRLSPLAEGVTTESK